MIAGVVYAWAGDQLVAIDAQTLDIRSVCQGPFAGISGLSKDGHLVFAQVEEGPRYYRRSRHRRPGRTQL